MLIAIHSPARIKNMKIILDFDYFPKNDLAVEKSLTQVTLLSHFNAICLRNLVSSKQRWLPFLLSQSIDPLINSFCDCRRYVLLFNL